MGFLRRCEEMEQDVEERFTKLVRAVMRRKEEILREIQCIKATYLQTKQRLDKQKEQYRLHLPREDLPLDNEVKCTLEKVGKEIQQKLEELSIREASYEEMEIGFCWEEEFLLRSIAKLGCVLIENAQPQTKPRTVQLSESPYLITHDTFDNSYYVIAVGKGSNYYGISLDSDFNVKSNEKLEKINYGQICTNDTCIYLSQTNQNVIHVYDKQWKYLRKFGQFGFLKDELIRPFGLCWYDSKLYVCDTRNNRIQVFTDEKYSAFIGADFTSKTIAPLTLFNPISMWINHQRELVVYHKGNPCFNVYSLEGTLLSTFGSLVSGQIPTRSLPALTTTNEIISIPTQNGAIQLYTENRNVCIRIGRSDDSSWNFNHPSDALSLQDNRIIVCADYRLYIFLSEDINLNSIFN